MTSVGALVGLAGLRQFSYGATTVTGSNKTGGWWPPPPPPSDPWKNWPLIPIHAVLLQNGRVLTYGTTGSGLQTGRFDYAVWDSGYNAANPGSSPDLPDLRYPESHILLPNGTSADLFCSAQIVLPLSGEVLIAGGDYFQPDGATKAEDGHTTNFGNENSVIFKPGDNSLNSGPNMRRSRWYASPTTLPDGRIYIQGGRAGTLPPRRSDRPEVRNNDGSGSFQLLGGADTFSLFFAYPRNFISPRDGRIFGFSDPAGSSGGTGSIMYYVDPNAQGRQGSFSQVGMTPSDGPSGWTSTQAMYAPGKILRTGGGSNALPEQGGPHFAAKNAAAVIDINGATPTYKKQPNMPVSLHWANATVLADGNVVVTGGSQQDNQLVGVNTRALLWKADTGNWVQGPVGSGLARLYHSVALLLPHGSVLVAGGGVPGPQANLNAELYLPNYLFDSSGNLAPRPSITGISKNSISWGEKFALGVDSPIQRVTLVKTGSVTHSCNFEQRFMKLSFTSAAAGELSVTAPTSAWVAPPGYYMIFAFSKQGVPSVAKIVRIGQV